MKSILNSLLLTASLAFIGTGLGCEDDNDLDDAMDDAGDAVDDAADDVEDAVDDMG